MARDIIRPAATVAADLSLLLLQDDGDPAKEVSPRDIVYSLEADAAASNGSVPRQIAATDLRFGGISWCDDGLALLYESWWKTRRSVIWTFAPGSPEQGKQVLFDRNYEDAYSGWWGCGGPRVALVGGRQKGPPCGGCRLQGAGSVQVMGAGACRVQGRAEHPGLAWGLAGPLGPAGPLGYVRGLAGARRAGACMTAASWLCLLHAATAAPPDAHVLKCWPGSAASAW
jgi:hypothetical protein